MAERINTLPPELLSKFQIIHSRVKTLDADKKKILVLHDLPGDPEVQHLRNDGWKKFDKLVFVSHWQQQMYQLVLGVPYSAGIVIQNAITPFQPHYKPDTREKPIRLIYFSTPHRGLELLLPVYRSLQSDYGNKIELKVFSSFDLYGWDQRDEPYKRLFEELEKTSGVTYSKSVSNEVIREELKDAHILAYPSIWPETSCLVLIESMAAGLTCVHSSLAALPETAVGSTYMYGFTDDGREHMRRLAAMLTEAIEDVKDGYSLDPDRLGFINDMYSWDRRKHEWLMMLNELLTF